jgi:outer membrane biosynthesis protein TonB
MRAAILLIMMYGLGPLKSQDTLDIKMPQPVIDTMDLIKAVTKLSCKYPPSGREMELTGQVYVEVIIDTLGKIASTRVIKGFADKGKPGEQMNMEACNCLKRITELKPYVVNGKPVSVKLVIPVNFQMH